MMKLRRSNGERKSRQWLVEAVLWAAILGLLWPAAPVAAQGEPTAQLETDAKTWYVDVQTGADSNSCGTMAAPCKSIQWAVQRASSSDQILVAAGVYRYMGAANDNPCDRFWGGLKTVVCVINKQLTITGGYASGNWETPNPASNLTVIDGENRVRGVFVAPGLPSKAGITLSGFTIRNGYAIGASSGNEDINGFGGGMLTDNATIVLRQLVFEDNVVEGGNKQLAFGGAASGGALAIRSAAVPALLEDLLFRRNRAQGGAGGERGGHGIAGALYLLNSSAQGKRLTITDNTAQGGNTSGPGVSGGIYADAFGAAVTIQGGGDVTLEDIVATNNLAAGGKGITFGGGAFGGAIKIEGAPWRPNETASLHLINADVRNNKALGASSAIGGYAAGGGLESFHATVFIERSTFIGNIAQGGDGTQKQGPAGGGGLLLQNTENGDSTATVSNNIIANNEVRLGAGSPAGGGGGGVWLQGVQATLSHNTIAQNKLVGSPTQGSAIMVMHDNVTSGARVATLNYNIIAEHDSPRIAALHVKPGNTAQLKANLFAANTGGDVNGAPAGAVIGMATSVLAADPAFLAPGAPAFDYSISPFSPAVNAAAGSTETQDRYTKPRVQTPDIGAVEARPFVITLAVGDGLLRVFWGDNPGVRAYRVKFTCPDGANPPTGVACNVEDSVPGTAASREYAGLSNYAVYGVSVRPDSDTPVSPATSSAFPTDLLVYVPVVLNK